MSVLLLLVLPVSLSLKPHSSPMVRQYGNKGEQGACGAQLG